MLEITHLTVTLGHRPVVQDISLTARAGEVLAVCGPNGAGKSTLLRAVLAELSFGGEVRLNGQDVARTPPARMARLRAVLPQDSEVAFAFTLRQIVAMGHAAGMAAPDPGIVDAALLAVRLHDKADRAFRSLSGGERQRGHLARALAQVWQPCGPEGPCWLFLDEPVSSLDLGHQMLVMHLARAFADAGGGVVAVMHDLNLSARFADRIAFVIDGRLAAIGPPEAVLKADLLERAYGCQVRMNTPPLTGPWLVPQACAPL